jgi:putative phage-type endonuclease
MITKNLILTPVANMSRGEWLAFRQPVTHVAKFVDEQAGDQKLTYDLVSEILNSNAWHQFMFPCLGASETATVMGLNQYKSVVELFYEKCGLIKVPDFDNVAMFWGRELEEQIAEKWQYWDGSAETMIDNFKAGKIIRKCRRNQHYIQNKSFPWLFVSLDRIINKSKDGTGNEGCLECKTISGYSADQWESGFPPQYVVQVQTQIGVCELEFGEMGILKDGRYMDVLPFDRHEDIISNIVQKSKVFFDNVKAATAHYVLSLYGNEEQKKKHLALIDNFCPDADGSVSYENYMKDRFKDKGGEILGNDEMMKIAKDLIAYKATIDDWENKERLAKNQLKTFMGEASKIDFGVKGFVSWKADSRGIRKLIVKIKE